ncbi:TetR/AcrR family transcriptional regulator [Paenibacillus oceani]|uniref:TetR/AcrR family transcriptional regulator n=1 Tax=Paenibacillus oceani TaxID=2772510 RepID=UPI00295BC26E|nr:TetR/AcrR family transcriptional regulator [Paenibacillus oceani]
MDEAVRHRIVEIAHQFFIKRGYRHVTMQNIAEELGMSKKTLYLYFASKEDIAQTVIENTFQSISNHVDASTAVDGNPLVALRVTLMKIREETLQLSPFFLEDIQKTVPHLWEYIVRVRSEKGRFVTQLLNKAKEQGLIRSTLNPHIITVLFIESVQTIIRPDIWSKHGFALDELWDTLFSVFFYGVSNEEEHL